MAKALPTGYRLETVQRVRPGIALVPARGSDPAVLAAAAKPIARICGAHQAETADPWCAYCSRMPHARYGS